VCFHWEGSISIKKFFFIIDKVMGVFLLKVEKESKKSWGFESSISDELDQLAAIS